MNVNHVENVKALGSLVGFSFSHLLSDILTVKSNIFEAFDKKRRKEETKHKNKHSNIKTFEETYRAWRSLWHRSWDKHKFYKTPCLPWSLCCFQHLTTPNWVFRRGVISAVDNDVTMLKWWNIRPWKLTFLKSFYNFIHDAAQRKRSEVKRDTSKAYPFKNGIVKSANRCTRVARMASSFWGHRVVAVDFFSITVSSGAGTDWASRLEITQQFRALLWEFTTPSSSSSGHRWWKGVSSRGHRSITTTTTTTDTVFCCFAVTVLLVVSSKRFC